MHAALILTLAVWADAPIRMRPVVICDTFTGGYQVAVADLNRDDRPDILALGEGSGTVEWFENPGQTDAAWARHPISARKNAGNIDLAPYDIDGDGRLDLAIASDFDLAHSEVGGTVSWLYREKDDATHWMPIRIHAEPTAHRIRWADVDGNGRKELIIVPILGRGAKPPSYQEAPARITCHFIPADPLRAPWPEQVIDVSLTVAHGVCISDWNGDGRSELLTASNQGIHLFTATGSAASTKWSRTQLAAGHAGSPPNCGASEIAVGRLPNRARFLATIEPWHGNEVVVYTTAAQSQPATAPDHPPIWRRQVLDDSLPGGHALCCADLDGDGIDEIVAGHRGKGTSLYGYHRLPAEPDRWERFTIDDGGIAAQGCVAVDMNADGRIDLIATGGATHNVKLYLSESPHPRR